MNIQERANQRNEKPKPVPYDKRCESLVCAANLPTVRCEVQGELYKVTGKLTTGFARLCARHRGTYEKQGYTLEAVSPIESSGRQAVGL